MSKPPKLAAADREQLVARLGEWAQNHPEPDRPIFAFAGGAALSPMELSEAVSQGTPDGEAFLRVVELGLKRATFDEVLASFAKVPVPVPVPPRRRLRRQRT